MRSVATVSFRRFFTALIVAETGKECKPVSLKLAAGVISSARRQNTATRMLGYLYRVTSPRAEDVVDEMLAILSDRKAWIEKRQSEEAQAAISRMYREGL